jgi:MATE family multidrug resistance protein
VSLTRVMMTLNLLGLALKVPLNWMFVFGHWGAPEMGAAGCALSTTVVNWTICVLAWLWAGKAGVYRPHRVFARWSWPRWRDQQQLIALGTPIGGTFLVDVTAFTFMALFVARLGAVNSAAHQIAANVAAVMYMLPLATGNAVGVLVGQAIGARRLALARSTGLTGIALAAGLAVIAALALAFAARAVTDAYTIDPDVRRVASGLLLLVGAYHVFDSTSAVAVNALRGYKRAVVPFLVNIVGLWGVGLAGGYLIGLTDVLPLSALGLTTPLGVPGFWLGAIAGMAVAASAIVVYFVLASEPRKVRAVAEEAPTT